jgi:Tol biopolymer transport system component/DNA-binding winged helix-turn-helix (wHTH) protein
VAIGARLRHNHRSSDLPHMPPARRVRFGPFELDTRTHELLKAGRRIRVRDQPIRILRALLERPGDLVTREELRTRLWPAETFVDFDHGLNTAVRRLRDALGDSADAPRFIETLPRRGYRFIGTIDAADTIGGDATRRSVPDNRTDTAAAPPTVADVAHTSARAAANTPSRSRPWLVAAATASALALSAAALSSRWSDRHDAPASVEAQRLTFDDGLQTNPSFSPDGQSLAYAGNETGQFDIWTQRMADGGAVGSAVRITTNPAHDWQPDWSPDGNAIAFRSERGDGGLFVVPATSGAETRLTDFGYRPRWSPDGRMLLFTESTLWRGGSRLYVVGLDDHEPQPLPEDLLGASGWRPHSREVVALTLPVGSPVLFRSVDVSTAGAGIVEWTVDDAVTQRFRDDAVTVWSDPLDWGADARTVFFVGEVRGVRNLWQIDVDVANRRVTGGPHPVTAFADAHTFSVSSSDQRLAIERSARTAQLWSYEMDAAGRIREDRAEPVTPEAEHAVLPDVSSDGTRVVFVRAKPGSQQQRDLVVRELATGHERILRTVDDRHELLMFPRWSRSGRRVSYTNAKWSGPDAMQQQVHTVDLERDVDGPLTSSWAFGAETDMPLERANSWTPDDRFLVSSGVRYVDGHNALVLLPADGAPRAEMAAVVVTKTTHGRIHQPSISPDGQWIAFRASGMPGRPRARLAIVSVNQRDADETSWRVATGEKWSVDKPRWSSTGDRIYFTSNNGWAFNLWSIAFDSRRGMVIGTPRQETTFSDPARQIYPNMALMEISVAAHHVILPIVRAQGGIWTVARAAR